MPDESHDQFFKRRARAAIAEDISAGLRELLESRHLYQSVKIGSTFVDQSAKELQAQINSNGQGNVIFELTGQRIRGSELGRAFKEYSTTEFSASWDVLPELCARKMRGDRVGDEISIIAPPAEIYCRKCKTVKTHNSGALNIEEILPAYPLGYSEQVFTCGYQCQSCRTAPVVFQITRRGPKVTLTGMSEYPAVDVPRIVPDAVKEYFSEAKIAESAGRILAGLFFLRTLVEQHMRTATGLVGRKSGDELWDAYAQMLDEDFPSRDRLLGTIYSELSEKLHAADADPKQFTRSTQQIERFFSVLALYPLKPMAR